MADDLTPTFEIKEYLDDLMIHYWTEGSKNVSRGWIGIECIFCDDSHNHLGISLSTKRYSCWKCAAKGDLYNLIMELEGIPFPAAKERIKEYQGAEYQEEQVTGSGKDEVEWPMGATTHFPSIHTRYLVHRGFDPGEVIPRYRLRAVHAVGTYKFRLVIPVFMGGKMVNFTARDVTEKAEHRYVHCPNKEAAIPMRNVVYGLDEVSSAAVITEGVFDAWKIGGGAICLFGMTFTREQVHYLLKSSVERFFIMFDRGRLEQRNARRLANALSMAGKQAEVIELLDYKDPGSLPPDEIHALRRELAL